MQLIFKSGKAKRKLKEKSRLLKNKLFFPFSIFYLLSSACCLLLAADGLTLTASAQKIAFLTPDKSSSSQKIREKLESFLSKDFQILDDAMVEIIPQNSPDQNFFNLSTEDAQNFGRAAGCNFFVLAKAETLRRAILSKPDFYIESYAVVYLVSSRTGRLIFWKLTSFKSPTAAESEGQLSASIENLAQEISANIIAAGQKESNAEQLSNLEELPAENSAEAKNFRPPLPYRRLKPEYTALASLYNVTATIDAAVDLDEKGVVKKVEIMRWAGYGLDESVAETIRKMQWRGAARDGKNLPIRVLLRYNFKKIERDDN
ncbi:MAG: energy transducer TonB [Pyrinomonadaceae bacterium]